MTSEYPRSPFVSKPPVKFDGFSERSPEVQLAIDRQTAETIYGAAPQTKIPDNVIELHIAPVTSQTESTDGITQAV